MVSPRIQSLSAKEFALGGPMNIGPRMSENAMSTDFHGIHELKGPNHALIKSDCLERL